MWPFRRRSADASTPGEDADGGEVLRPARTDWRSLEPLPQPMPLSTIDRGFEESLATRARPVFIANLSHHVHPTAPAGTIDGFAVPGVARAYAAPTAAAQRITSADLTAPPAVQRAPTPTATSPVSSSETVLAPRPADQVADRAPVGPPAPSPDVAPAEESGLDEPPPVDVVGADDDVLPVEEVAERPLLNERAPLATVSADGDREPDAMLPIGGRAVEPTIEVQRRIDLATPASTRPAMRIGAPLPASTDRALIGQRDASADDDPMTTVGRPADAEPERSGSPRLGAPHGPDVAIQRLPADRPALDAFDDAVSTPGEPTADAPLVGAAPIGPVSGPDLAAAADPSPTPPPAMAGSGNSLPERPPPGRLGKELPTTAPQLGGGRTAAVQRTVFDATTPPTAAPPLLAGAIEPAPTTAAAVVARSLATEAATPTDAVASVPTVEAPLVGAAEPLVDIPSTADAPVEIPPAPPVWAAAASETTTAAPVATTVWTDGPAAPTAAPLDGRLLGDRPPTLTIDWLERSPAADAKPAAAGRADVATRAPSTPPVVSRTLGNRSTTQVPAAMVAREPDPTRSAPALAPGRAPVLQFGPPPTPTVPVLSFDDPPAASVRSAEAATSFELPVSLQREPLDDPAVDVPRAGEMTTTTATTMATAAAPTGSAAASAAPGATGRSEAELVELARVLYPQLQRRLARDLLLDRERAGYRTDIRF
jgi:hypothetical protein